MFSSNGSSIECGTCVAANTSACSECVVSYILANDAGPIEFAPVEVASVSPADVVVGLFVRAGLVDDPVVFLTAAEFGSGALSEVATGVGAR